ncbi:Hypothetical protein AA314_02682 [Archangium gephyra]|uniref:Uncharacterized protein n=1 Tax=Archangium gephyra TaxID=48 RepID=A0AAC8Q5S0_9BACT|nr:Hypothetical protein AA314_02682 [Archangium gephyra]
MLCGDFLVLSGLVLRGFGVGHGLAGGQQRTKQQGPTQPRAGVASLHVCPPSVSGHRQCRAHASEAHRPAGGSDGSLPWLDFP